MCVSLHLVKKLSFAKGVTFKKNCIKFSTLIETIERSGDEDIIVWDEGVVSVGLFHATSVEHGEIIDAIFDNIGKRFYICIYIDLRTGLERWRNRYPRRATSKSSRRAIALLRKHNRVIAVVIERLRTAYPDRVLVLDGSTPAIENVNTAFEFISANLQRAHKINVIAPNKTE